MSTIINEANNKFCSRYIIFRATITSCKLTPINDEFIDIITLNNIQLKLRQVIRVIGILGAITITNMDMTTIILELPKISGK